MESIVFIQDVYNTTGIGAVPVGLVKKGVLKIGMKINIDGHKMELKSMEYKHKPLKEAMENQLIGMALFNSNYKILKSVLKQDVVFSDAGEIVSEPVIKPIKRSSNHPKGPIQSLFSKFFGS